MMASYHFSAKIFGRSAGESVVAKSAYRSGTRIARNETGDDQDYRHKSGVVSAHLMLPEAAPDWARDRSKLWNAVEAKETRKNSQLAREIIVSLPHELTSDQARELVLSWARTNFVDMGMAVDVAIHDPDPGDYGNRNTHAHVMATVREFDEVEPDGWAKTKNRTWNDRQLLEGWRESWADEQNAALEAAGSDARVDHRTLAAQSAAAAEAGDLDLAAALDRTPEPRMGVTVSAAERREMARSARVFEVYEPVTERAREVQEHRSIRSRIASALRRLIGARADQAAAEAELAEMRGDLVADQAIDLSAPEEPLQETDTGPGF